MTPRNRSHDARPRARRTVMQSIVKPVVFLASLYPLARMVFFGFTGRMGANPVEFVTHSTGTWALVFLCITLAVTPVRKLSGVNALLRLRRMLGLFCFFYAALHFLTYIWLDQFFNWPGIVADIGRRPFILVGFAAFVLLLVLAVTSPRAVVRRLGRHWRTLHRAIYAVALLALLHFWWLKGSKNNLAEPRIYVTIVAVLLLMRLVLWWAPPTGRGGPSRRVAADPAGPAASSSPQTRQGPTRE